MTRTAEDRTEGAPVSDRDGFEAMARHIETPALVGMDAVLPPELARHVAAMLRAGGACHDQLGHVNRALAEIRMIRRIVPDARPAPLWPVLVAVAVGVAVAVILQVPA